MSYSEILKRWGTGILLLGLGTGFYIAYTSIGPAEDAVILFDYSRNLATRGVITYGTGSSAPVEGATDFLYMILITLTSKLGLTEFASALALNYLAILLIFYVFWRTSSSTVLPLVAVAFTPFFYATLMGFSAILFASVYVLCLFFTLQKDRRLYVAILGLCLLRPDGIVWSAGLVAIRLVQTEKPHLTREVLHLCFCLVAPGLAYFAWRVWYFGEWLPLPFIVKSSGERDFGVTAQYLLPILIPAAAGILCVTDKLELTRRLSSLFALPIIFYSSIRLEQNIGDRFLAPMFFGTLLVLVSQHFKTATRIFIFLSVCLMWQLTSQAFDEIEYSTKSTARPIGLELRKLPPGKLLSTEAGMLTYYSEWGADDSWGLNTPKYAHRLITRNDIASGSYDLIMAHCDINLLATITQPGLKTPATRTWVHHCEAMSDFLHSSGYSIYLVPTLGSEDSNLDYSFIGPGTTCVPHLIYAVSPTYVAAPRVKDILRRFGASEYDQSARMYVGGDICRTKRDAEHLSRLHSVANDLSIFDDT